MHATDTAALKPSRSSSTFVCQLILLSHLTLIIILTDVEIEVSVTQRVKKNSNGPQKNWPRKTQ